MRQSKAMYLVRVQIGLTVLKSLGLSIFDQAGALGHEITRPEQFAPMIKRISKHENSDISDRVDLLVRIHTAVYNSCKTRAQLRAWKRQRVEGRGHASVGYLLCSGHLEDLESIVRHMVIRGHM